MFRREDIEQLRGLRLGEDVVRLTLSGFLYRDFSSIPRWRLPDPNRNSQTFLRDLLDTYAADRAAECLDSDTVRQSLATFLVGRLRIQGLTEVYLCSLLSKFAKSVHTNLDKAVALMAAYDAIETTLRS